MNKTIILALTLALGLAKLDANAGFVISSNEEDNICFGVSSSVSSDGLTMFVSGDFSLWKHGKNDLGLMTRETTNSYWFTLTPVHLGASVNSSAKDMGPNITADALTLYFNSDRPDGSGGHDLWVTTRPTIDNPWSEPINLGPIINSLADDADPSISTDQLSLYFTSTRHGGSGLDDLWVTTRPTINDPWSEPVNLGPTINSPDREYGPCISANGLTLFFSSTRTGGYGGDYGDIWMTRRRTTDDEWGEPVNLGLSINSSLNECFPNISADGSTLYFSSNDRGLPRGGIGWAIWGLPINLVIDLNGDNFIDAADICIMVDHWGTDEPSCDLAPPPLGDGIVDEQDLVVLAEHLFKDTRLVAHWKLDEIEGNIASDSVGNHNATLYGNPSWQDTNSKVDGALEFDGVDDYVSTPFVLDTYYSACSVFAWIKSATPNRVIISQTDGDSSGATWLGVSSNGTLIGPYIDSLVDITDEQWHHIGLVWDREYTYLYLDGTEVAKSSSYWGPLIFLCNGGLNIGADKDLNAGSFFSGLIDDVRIYNKALSADEIAVLVH